MICPTLSETSEQKLCKDHTLCDETLYVITVVSNPVRYKTRYILFEQFVQRMKREPNIQLITVELQHGERAFATDATIKYRTTHELWHKENMINKAVELLPNHWKYMAWIDADLSFNREDWVEETLQQLQHYQIVQLFSHAIDEGPNGEFTQVHTGFGYQYAMGVSWKPPAKYQTFWHPGYAWACTRSAFDGMGGLVDFAVLGSADQHMALAWIGQVNHSYNDGIHPNYKMMLNEYQNRCDGSIRRNIGFVYGIILHKWHGSKANRRYKERWTILVEHAFDPVADVSRDWQGLYQLKVDRIGLRDDIRHYFRGRNEDCIYTGKNTCGGLLGKTKK